MAKEKPMSKKDVISTALNASNLGSLGVAILAAAQREAQDFGVKK